MGSLLERGRTYANTGRVLSLALNNGRVLAKVAGKSSPSYRVEISFPPLQEAEQVYRIIENAPPLLARIAAGELPESFMKMLKKRGIDLIPRRWQEMKRFCSCPDHGDPCKHMAALYYIIAREIDSCPHVLFRLRGMDLEARLGKEVVHSIMPPFTITYAEGKKSAQGKAETESGENQSGDVDSPPVLEEIPRCAELIASLLPSAPPFCARDFTLVLSEFYHRCAQYQTWESANTEANSEMEHQFSRSVWTVVCSNPAPGSAVFLDMKDINGNIRRFTPYSAFEYFIYFSCEDGTASYTFFFYLFKFLNLVCASGAYIPYVLASEKTLQIIWRPFETLPLLSIMLHSIAARETGALIDKKTVSGRSVVDLVSASFLNEWVRRRALNFGSNFNRQARRNGDEYRELLGIFFYSEEIDVSSPMRHSLPAAIDRWLSVLHINFAAYRYSLTVDEATRRPGDKDLSFSITMHVSIEDEGEIKNIPLSRCKDLDMLLAPTVLSNYLPEIRSLAARRLVRLSEARLIAFLDSAAVLLTRLGMTVNLPKALARELKPRLVVKGSSSGGSLKTYLDLDALLEFEWNVAIGDKIMTLEEFQKLIKEKRDLVRFKDGFVKMEPEAFNRLLKKAKNSTPTFNDFLKAHFSGDTVLGFDARQTIDNLFREHDFPVPAALNAELRPYQKRGYNWVCSLLNSGFGCILADDMGLGKTIQSITVLLWLKEAGLLGRGCLIVAPAALLSNWEKEFSRFAPIINVSRYHGHNRIINRKYDVFLTTYQTAVRDAAKLKDVNFSLLLVDEAHLMKNNETRIAKTAKLLRSQYRLALSGTPVENRLEDLRSLFDFILPGYLGNAADFRTHYRIPIEVMRNTERAENLRKIISPFLLRRLKTDKNIIEDLPEKIVSNEYAVLEKDQAALYETLVAESMRKSENSESKDRAALILTLLTSLKQICDHPRVFDKKSPAVSALSGKAQLLVTLLGEILANREKTLVFSQYVETLDCLEKIIKKELGEAALVYHGGLGQKARTSII
ncbi:MAG: SNF2-related protein, partial [Treponema sp.]|nr:SNF2-related protein [Treponema sp.]